MGNLAPWKEKETGVKDPPGGGEDPEREKALKFPGSGDWSLSGRYDVPCPRSSADQQSPRLSIAPVAVTRHLSSTTDTGVGGAGLRAVTPLPRDCAVFLEDLLCLLARQRMEKGILRRGLSLGRALTAMAGPPHQVGGGDQKGSSR